MPNAKRALISGITGQDGSYLAELLLAKGYEVHGIVRRTSTTARTRIEHLHSVAEATSSPVVLHYGDMADLTSLTRIVERVAPGEVYNLAAQSHVRVSFDMPEYTYEVTGMGAFRMLEAVRRAAPQARFYQAGSSEMFGEAKETPQNEDTPFHPRSPYAIAKVFAHHVAVHYREAYGLFVSNGILFNHESPRRGENFLTRKVAIAAARIAQGLEKFVELGTLDAKRDWGYAPEYVEAMWLMLQQPTPDDFVIATGESHSVEEFVAAAFDVVGLDWRQHVVHQQRFERPTEVLALVGDATKARKLLGWESRVKFGQLVRLMVEAELAK
jgi:GDPmannose 4,6-dehydratase